ncbi:MAG: TIGR00341 family protein [Candidatus Aminicenantes bacterium]|nr:TIGR00341 family protein [Candidatus Aminicenantes bacterium]MDH5386756.1 TIGR00341 family protein [Candidatus Aminicenantes bacterium]MDH5744064.1 TIGR00341 family protein [Candidatus Aminicenantes bacterium]
MPLRLIEIILPEGYLNVAEGLIQENDPLDFWKEEITEGQMRMKVLVPTEKTEPMMDALEERFYKIDGFRMVLFAVEASVPRPKKKENTHLTSIELQATKKLEKRGARIGREELYSDVDKMSRLSWVFIILIILASVVAAVGILRNNVVFIIGAMVIAPVLGPNVALSLGTTLGDGELSQRALKTIALGIVTVFVVSAIVGMIFRVDTQIPELVSRTEVNFGDIVLALAAGSAAVLSLSSGLVSALIGVMVAVALLPPLVTTGMLVGAGHWDLVTGSLLLFLVNFICVNLSGVITFIAQGIRPLTWWEANRAKKATRNAIILWTGLLFLLVLLIYLSQQS